MKRLLFLFCVGSLAASADAGITYHPPQGSSSSQWGFITGTLSEQTDLQNELTAKVDIPGSNGGLFRTAPGTITVRTITSSDGSNTVADGDGQSGNPDIIVDDTIWTRWLQGTAAPGTCTPLTLFNDTDDTTLSFCDSTNSWTVLSTGGVTASSTTTFTNKTIDANGTGNSISNIDIADLADGTDGQLITWDAAGAPAAVAVGTATHVLTSNGTGAAPTFQAPTGGSFDPLDEDTLWMRDEFAFGDLTSGAIGELGWLTKDIAGTGVISPAASTFDYAGQIDVSSGSAANDATIITSRHNLGAGTSRTFPNLGGDGPWDSKFAFRFTATADTRHRIGFQDSTSAIVPTNGFFLRGDKDGAIADTNFMFCVSVSGTESCASSGETIDSDAHTLRIRSTTAGTILMSLDGGSESSFCAAACDVTVTTPTAAMIAFFMAATDTTTAKVIRVDMFAFSATVTR